MAQTDHYSPEIEVNIHDSSMGDTGIVYPGVVNSAIGHGGIFVSKKPYFIP